MNRLYIILFVTLVVACGFTILPASAASQNPPTMLAMMNSDIYGHQLMNDYERAQYRNKVRNARSSSQREEIREEHQKMIQERAKQRGYKMRSAPPVSKSPNFKSQPKKRVSPVDRSGRRSKFKSHSSDRKSSFGRRR